ncbi:hypothetical protein AB3M96_16845 [Fredinandcohnia sp. 179-A 10B2 NHS]
MYELLLLLSALMMIISGYQFYRFKKQFKEETSKLETRKLSKAFVNRWTRKIKQWTTVFVVSCIISLIVIFIKVI